MVNDNKKYEKLCRTSEDDTVIYAGQSKVTVKQLEHEVKMDSEIGRKLKSVEHILEENY